MLRQAAVLLERENAKLHTKIQSLIAELARVRGEAAVTAQHELEFLKELLAQRERALFSASSEQRLRPQPEQPPTPPAPRRGHGPTTQPHLPRVEVVHELAAADQTCPQCGGTLKEMAGQTEDAEEITVVERRFVLLQHRRKKYRCACNGLRGMVLGRKNHYGSRSKRGTEVAALFYSLIESAKLCGVKPKCYLLAATRAALADRAAVTLPHTLITGEIDWR